MTTTDVLHALGELVFILDRDQRVTAAFGSGFRTGRFKTSEFIGKSIAEEWPPDVAALHVAMHTRALDGQVVAFDWEFPIPGSGNRMMTTLCPLYDKSGDVIGILRISRELGVHVRSVATSAVQSVLRSESEIAATNKERGRGRPLRKGQTGAGATGLRRVQVSSSVTRVLYGLSPRERLVVGLLLDSARAPEIGRELGISVHTVRQHLKHILRKAGVHSQQELLELLRGTRTRRGDRP